MGSAKRTVCEEGNKGDGCDDGGKHCQCNVELLGGITVKNERGGRVTSGRGRERAKREVGKKEEDEENQALAFYKKFQQQGPAYYGDLDEKDEQLIKFERKTEEEGENYRLQLN